VIIGKISGPNRKAHLALGEGINNGVRQITRRIGYRVLIEYGNQPFRSISVPLENPIAWQIAHKIKLECDKR